MPVDNLIGGRSTAESVDTTARSSPHKEESNGGKDVLTEEGDGDPNRYDGKD